jgi:hypothetical protein
MNSVLRIMFGSEIFQCSVKFIIHKKGDLEQIEIVSVDILKRVVLLVLNRSLERADVLCIHDLDGEDVTGFIAEN